MSLIQDEQKLLALDQTVLQTRDVAACLKISLAHASKILERLAKAGRFVRLMRGKWATSQKVDPLILPEFLTAPFPSYISLQTALFYHGMISQIPSTIYAVSLARTHSYQTPFGNISTHHIQADFFFGFETMGNIKMATPEKALLDILYLTPTKQRLFKTLPELEFTRNFNHKKAREMLNKVISDRRKTMMVSRLNDLLSSTKAHLQKR